MVVVHLHPGKHRIPKPAGLYEIGLDDSEPGQAGLHGRRTQQGQPDRRIDLERALEKAFDLGVHRRAAFLASQRLDTCAETLLGELARRADAAICRETGASRQQEHRGRTEQRGKPCGTRGGSALSRPLFDLDRCIHRCPSLTQPVT